MIKWRGVKISAKNLFELFGVAGSRVAETKITTLETIMTAEAIIGKTPAVVLPVKPEMP
jgi:hypothetical protein